MLLALTSYRVGRFLCLLKKIEVMCHQFQILKIIYFFRIVYLRKVCFTDITAKFLGISKLLFLNSTTEWWYLSSPEMLFQTVASISCIYFILFFHFNYFSLTHFSSMLRLYTPRKRQWQAFASWNGEKN